MNILVIHPDSFGGQGGIAALHRSLLEALSRCEQVKTVYAIARQQVEPLPELPAKLHFDEKSVRGKVAFMQRLFAFGSHVKSIDVVFCGHLHLLPFARLASWFYNCPLVLLLAGIESWERPRRRFLDSCIPHVDHIWSISKYTLNRFSQWAPLAASVSTHIVECAIDFEKFPRVERAATKHKETLSLVSVSRLSVDDHYKGIEDVLLVVAKNQAFTATICGEGNDRARLELRTRELGIEERVNFTGYVTEEQKLNHLMQSDVFVLPSRREGFGIVFIEALACGIPVVAANCAGAVDVLRNGELGQLVPPGNIAALEEAIWRAYEKGAPPLKALEDFSHQRFNRQVCELCTGIAAQKSQKKR